MPATSINLPMPLIVLSIAYTDDFPTALIFDTEETLLEHLNKTLDARVQAKEIDPEAIAHLDRSSLQDMLYHLNMGEEEKHWYSYKIVKTYTSCTAEISPSATAATPQDTAN